jgi:Mg2+ and Co2+ transporter CorA
MAKSEKRVSIGAMDKIMKMQVEPIVTEQWFDIEIRIAKRLGLKAMLEFVNDVVTSCFDENGNYLPEVMGFAIKSNILTKFSNFSLPANIEHRYDLIYNTDVVALVLKNIDREQLQEIIDAINHKIEYLCDANIAALQKQMHKMISAFEKMQEQVEGAFAGMKQDDMAKLIGAISDNGFSEDKIVEAYLRQTKNGTTRVEDDA